MRILISFLATLSWLAGFSAPVVWAQEPPQILFIGEAHDNPAHHDNQARMVAELRPKALVFEMLTPDQAHRITPEALSDPEGLAQRLDWDQSGWPDFAFYHPIMTAAPEARIYGAQVPRDEIRTALKTGVAAYFGDQAKAFGLTTPLPADQQATRMQAQQDAHCGMLPVEALPRMVDAQRLRDAVLAQTALTALTDTGGPVAVITGNGHARRDWGAPVYLTPFVPKSAITSIGQGEDGVPPVGVFDQLTDAPAPKRDDACAAFAVKSDGN